MKFQLNGVREVFIGDRNSSAIPNGYPQFLTSLCHFECFTLI